MNSTNLKNRAVVKTPIRDEAQTTKTRSFRITKNSPAIVNKAAEQKPTERKPSTVIRPPSTIFPDTEKTPSLPKTRILLSKKPSEEPQKSPMIIEDKKKEVVHAQISTQTSNEYPTSKVYEDAARDLSQIKSKVNTLQNENGKLLEKITKLEDVLRQKEYENRNLAIENDRIKEDIARERERSQTYEQRIQQRNSQNEAGRIRIIQFGDPFEESKMDEENNGPFPRAMRTFQTLNYLQMITAMLEVRIDNVSNQRENELAGFTPEQIRSIPTQKYRRMIGAKEDDKCSICLSDFEDGVKIRKLSCRHMFHSSCIKDWLYRKKTCPMCKREVTVN